MQRIADGENRESSIETQSAQFALSVVEWVSAIYRNRKNKANLPVARINVNVLSGKDYGKTARFRGRKNKANQNQLCWIPVFAGMTVGGKWQYGARLGTRMKKQSQFVKCPNKRKRCIMKGLWKYAAILGSKKQSQFNANSRPLGGRAGKGLSYEADSI